VRLELQAQACCNTCPPQGPSKGQGEGDFSAERRGKEEEIERGRDYIFTRSIELQIHHQLKHPELASTILLLDAGGIVL
jgi:hypothetical protein